MFNYQRIADDLKLSKVQLSRLEQTVRLEFPNDEMMFALHMVRVLNTIKRGHLSFDDAIKQKQSV